MFCPNCGAQLRDGAKFCAQCGAPAPQVDDPPSVPPTSEPTAPQAPQSAPTDESAQAAPVNEAASADEAPQPADAATPEPQAAPADAAASETETPPIAGQPTEQAPASPILRCSHDLLQKQQAGATTSSVPATGEPILGQRRHGLGIVIGLIAAVAAVIAVLALFVVPSVVQMASPKAYLGACASRTMENYTAAWENAAKQLGVDGLADAIREERMGYRISGSIVNALDEPMLSGAGFTMDAQVDYDEQEAAAALSVQYGAITTRSHTRFEERLAEIYDDMRSLLGALQPDVVAMETLFYQNNKTTAFAVSEARGVLRLCAQQFGVEVFEYTPMQVKQSVTGYGKASKRQVQDLTRRLLNMPEIPKPDDAADALAMAICHAYSHRSRQYGLTLTKRQQQGYF